jgi:hypothetical protein
LDELPLNLQDVSKQWLGSALGGVEVSGFDIVDASSGTTGRALIELQYAQPAALPARLFVKLPPQDSQQREFVSGTGMGRREALFYRHLSARVPVRVPRCFFAASNPAGDRYIMLLEDLASSQCTFRNASQRYSLDYLREVLSGFARLHAAFWDSPGFAAELDWIPPPPQHLMGARLVRRGLDLYASKMPPQFARMGKLYLEHTDAVHELWNAGVPTLVHGDCHDGNLFYDPGLSQPGFLDWALVGRTSCMRDVAYFLGGTLKPEQRGAQLQGLLDFYFQQLQSLGVTLPAREELLDQYAWHVAYVWVAAVTTLAMGSEWQPESYVWRSMERLNGALVDSDSIGCLSRSLT